jgi:D-alanyl-D-alanine carboxypeptidase/D-alanyl-D-alanine-endopeptidase (penicillin-binding protein 4)
MLALNIITAILVFTGKPCLSQEISKALSPEVEKILKTHSFEKDQLRFHFQDLDTPTIQIGHQEESPFIPASLTKVFTAVYALKHLGPDYRYKTELYTHGSLNKKNGIFTGDIILKGTGDPSLTMARLMDMVLELRSYGVKELKGNFYYDDTVLPSISMLSSFGNGDQTYNPGISALNLEYNRTTLYKDARQTKEAVFQVIPTTGHFFIQKEAKPFKNGKRFDFIENATGETWAVSNKERYRQFEDIPVRKPSKRTANSFKKLAELWGIKLPTPRPKKLNSKAVLRAQDLAPPLSRLLALTLEFSNNLFAEQIMLSATKEKNIARGALKLSNWLNKRIPKCTPQLVNGSGLTFENEVRPNCFTAFLSEYALKPGLGRGFMSMLSISGGSGWMRKRLRTPETAYRVWAKTGSLDYIDNMTGVLFSSSGKRYAFVISVSDLKKRAIIDEAIQSKKILKLKREVKKWRRRSRKTAEELLTHFIQTL